MPATPNPLRPAAKPGGVLSRLAKRGRQLLGREQVAFVFSGGGSLGAVQIGMLRALVDAGIQADFVVGASVGAINGAGYAYDPTLRGVGRLERIWTGLANGEPELMPSGRIPLAVQLARKGDALHSPESLRQMLVEELGNQDFNQLKIPFQCVATDLELASEHWFSEGPVVPALMASASLPAVYPAVELDGRTYIDGGVLSEVHTTRAAEFGATTIYVLHVGHLSHRWIDVQRPFDSAMRAYWTARRFRLHDDLARIPGHCTVHVLPAGETPRLRFDDFSQAQLLVERSYEGTANYLAGISSPHEPIDRHEPLGYKPVGFGHE